MAPPTVTAQGPEHHGCRREKIHRLILVSPLERMTVHKALAWTHAMSRATSSSTLGETKIPSVSKPDSA